MEASALRSTGLEGLRGPTPFLRLQSDERLVALVRRGNQSAYEALVARYQSRLLAFCKHMLGTREDAEDVLQEVFAAAYNAMVADTRPLNVRPWLYRIARNRSLNHLRKQTAVGVDSMDHHLAEHGATTADKVHRREALRELVADIQTLAETQRTALLLREIDALSYEQIAEAMETTVPSVKSLLVRARVALAEASEARKLTCGDVREELAEVAEGLRGTTAPVRRHLRTCERCSTFRKHLRSNNRALAFVMPLGPLLLLKKLVLANAGAGASATAAAGASAGAASTASVGASAIASKAVATVAAAAIVTAGAVEVEHVRERGASAPQRAAVAPPVPAPPVVPVASEPQVVASVAQTPAAAEGEARSRELRDEVPAAVEAPSAAGPPEPAAVPTAVGEPAPDAGTAAVSLPVVVPGQTAGNGGVAAPGPPPPPPAAAQPAPSGSQPPSQSQSAQPQPQPEPAPAEPQPEPAPAEPQPQPEPAPAEPQPGPLAPVDPAVLAPATEPVTLP